MANSVLAEQRGPPSAVARWLYALKPASFPKLLVPALLGQAIGVRAIGQLDVAALVVGIAFTLCELVFIVLLNDWGDQHVDALKRRWFPHAGSPKTIFDGVLPASQLLVVGCAAGTLGLAVSVAASVAMERPHAAVLGAVCLGLFVAYTLRPLRLNYRGGGELLEAVGVGALLPAFNVYLQVGKLELAALWPLVGYSLFSLASAIASGLSDEESDRLGGKRTIAAIWGNAFARRAVRLSMALGAVALPAAAYAVDPHVFYAAAIPALFVLSSERQRRSLDKQALTNAFAAQGAYKRALHRAIWGAGLLLVLLLCFDAMLIYNQRAKTTTEYPSQPSRIAAPFRNVNL